jgi:hypothetical protein
VKKEHILHCSPGLYREISPVASYIRTPAILVHFLHTIANLSVHPDSLHSKPASTHPKLDSSHSKPASAHSKLDFYIAKLILHPKPDCILVVHNLLYELPIITPPSIVTQHNRNKGILSTYSNSHPAGSILWCIDKHLFYYYQNQYHRYCFTPPGARPNVHLQTSYL